MGAVHSKLRADRGDTYGFVFTNSSGGTLNGGDVHVVENKVGLIRDDVDDTNDEVLITFVPPPGVVVPRNTNDAAWVAGETLYLDLDSNGNSNDQFTNQSTTNTTSNPEVGYVYADTAAGDSEGRAVLTDEQV